MLIRSQRHLFRLISPRLRISILLFHLHLFCICADVRLPPRVTAIRVSPPPQTPLRYFRPDDSITLECEADGVPRPELSWYYNLNPVSLINVMMTRPGVLQISNAGDYHEGDYQCHAQNQYGTAVSNVTTLKRAQLAQYSANTDVNDKYELDEGTAYVLRCLPTKSIPRASFSWAIAASLEDSRNEEIVLDKRVQMDSDGNLHFSYLMTSDHRDGKLYKCNLRNPILDITIGGSYSRINVKSIQGGIKPFGPTLLFDTVQTKVIVEGRNTSLRCFFSAYPEPSLRWYRKNENGNMIQMPTSRHDFRNFNSELLIFNVHPEDLGQYYCEARNTQGDATHNFNIEVEAAPIFQDYWKRPHNMNVTEGETAIFVCDPYGKPPPKLEWFRNAIPLNLNHLPAKYHLSADMKRLSISSVCKVCMGDVEPSDLTVIQCQASNKHGTSFTDAYLNILKKTEIVSGLPEKIDIVKDGETLSIDLNCESISDDSTPVTTRWFFQRPAKQPVFVSLYPIPNKILFSRDNMSVTLMVKNASEWDDLGGVYKCNASNQYTSQISTTSVNIEDLDVVTEVPISMGTSQAGMLWWLLLVVAAILLLIILIICCCICCYRNRGDVYSVDKKERKTGNDPLKEIKVSGFHDYQRPAGEALKGSRASLGSSLKMDSDDEESLNAYGDIDAGKFGEDGSFIGDYATNDRRNNYQRV